jgi:hypothetical protein
MHFAAELPVNPAKTLAAGLRECPKWALGIQTRVYEVAVYTWTASNCDLIGTICGRPIMGGTSVICNWYEPCAQQSGDSYMILSPLGLNDSQLGLYVELPGVNYILHSTTITSPQSTPALSRCGS